jgi:hypothetical protein
MAVRPEEQAVVTADAPRLSILDTRELSSTIGDALGLFGKLRALVLFISKWGNVGRSDVF